ncbi:MAG TPA: hypothetical protein PLZ51_23195, partial [Aggregatilineales bacterium]|nr:hypothetical protein [Aggregatilineales bacterium]
KKYDVDMTTWQNPDMRQQVLSRFPTQSQRDYWESIWNSVVAEKIKTWDYQWMYACVTHNGLCAMPYENQISNIGIDADGTNTKNASSPLANLPTYSIIFPLKHPIDVTRNSKADL